MTRNTHPTTNKLITTLDYYDATKSKQISKYTLHFCNIQTLQ